MSIGGQLPTPETLQIPPKKQPHDRARRVDLTGDHRATIYTAARRLLAAGADPADIVETWRNGQLSMSGVIGECAKWEVVETGGYGFANIGR